MFRNTVRVCYLLSSSTQTKEVSTGPIMAQPTKHIAGFEMDAELQLKTGQNYILICICITDDNKLLLTNNSGLHPKLYVYKHCKDYETELTFSSNPRCVAVIPDTYKAVVTLPEEKSVQFINTKKMTKGDKVKVGFSCYGITTGHDNIFVGTESGTFKTLDTNGKILKSITLGSENKFFMTFNDIHEQVLITGHNKLLSIKLDGTLVYSKNVSCTTGVARDRQGNIYYGGHYDSNIQKMSSDGKDCEVMLNKGDDIIFPFAMCFNNDFTKLFVINNDYKSVCVYKCKY